MLIEKQENLFYFWGGGDMLPRKVFKNVGLHAVMAMLVLFE